MTAFSSAHQVPVLRDMSTNKIKKSNKKSGYKIEKTRKSQIWYLRIQIGC